MKSLFLRMLLWFCGASAVLVTAIVIGYAWSNPDQLPFSWPRVGRGAIVSAARVAVDSYERGGQSELLGYLKSLSRDAGLDGALYDSSARELSGRLFAPALPTAVASYPKDRLLLRLRPRLAGIRLRGRTGNWYTFLTTVPRREPGGFWSRAFIVSFVLTGAVLCYFLARHITAPVVHLRALTSRFSRGDLTARITLPSVLERKDEIGGLARDFNQMASRIETLLKSQQRLIADVSHELRSPITRLSLAIGLIRRQKEGDPRTSLARMEREVERLNALIAQLLTLSRLESLDQPPPTESIDLSTLVREIAVDADFEATSMNRNVRLGECAACSMRGARDLLRSAVENVVRNAVKYTTPNSQVLVRLLRVNGNQTATIVVEDEGPGVPPEALDHMFEPFYRIDEARDRSSGGAGLGLAITRQIVTLHGGSVCAANRDAGGLEMRITLPVDGAF
jgi:two-component system, OmpR family, sensor histidine kinase CpxA